MRNRKPGSSRLAKMRMPACEMRGTSSRPRFVESRLCTESQRDTNVYMQVFNFRQMLFLAYSSVGVIYGDIGTSPLYVFSSTFTVEPSHADLRGALSLIIWSLTLMVTIKYVLIILHADNDGEGGTFSTYSLLARYANIANRDPREASLIRKNTNTTITTALVLINRRNGTATHE
jgi:hypothetical protein